ncbi:extracellular solute-binding protein [Streptomyces sp. TRM66268-LWL]|uniref:Extracellular solute-binding protein n=1 Tax=Streptomyces polyasparticus TaxID=2767826 RepID=A0ABR7SEN2_9ACTN|nr:extracellular solute-binding protein [Streptomyces polyasparticus]MBC9713334.1 extracellular solute-binding protein [Streptomyces polyasparticus]
MSSSTEINRRSLLRLGLGAGLGLAAAPLLAACGDGGTQAKAGAKDAALLPKTTPRNIGLKPDLPGTAAGVPNGYFTYPAQPTASVKGAPLKGAKTVKATLQTYAPPPPGRDENAAWQAIEKKLGAQVDITIVPADDYPTKFSTMVAGDNIADIFMYPETGGADNKAGFLAAKCADLTPFLAGDKVSAYPNLAAITKAAWQDGIFGGRLYGIPISRAGSGGVGFYRHDLYAQAGVESLDDLTDVAAFVELCKDLTRPKKDQYALSATAINLLAMSYGAPYDWRLEQASGKFTLDLETEEFRKAVETARELYKAGCYYPGSLAMTAAQKEKYTGFFKNGKAAYVYDGMPAYLTPSTGYLDAMAGVDKKFDPRPMTPIGSSAVAWPNNLALSYVFIKKADDKRVKQLIALADFAAAPFGSEEYTLINYGVEGVDHTRDAKGNPVLTKQGTQDTVVPWRLFGSAVPDLFSTSSEVGVRHLHAAYSKIIPLMLPKEYAGYSSPTWDSKGSGSLFTLKSDGLKDLISGRKPMSAYDQLVKDYLAQGGEQARTEFQEALQQGKKVTAK